nr:replication initiation factor domain-containing protein [Geomonas sp. Red32]
MLYRCYRHEAVTANTVKGSDRSSRTRTLTFGASPSYRIYEAGLFHQHINNPDLCRHELELEGRHARQFFAEWRKAPENLEGLIKGYISGHFNVQFKQVTEDSNVGRRPVLPAWKSWLSSSTPVRFDRVTPTKPQTANQRKSLEARMLKTRLEIGEEAYLEALANVDRAYCQDRYRDEQSPERQLIFDFGGTGEVIEDGPDTTGRTEEIDF